MFPVSFVVLSSSRVTSTSPPPPSLWYQGHKRRKKARKGGGIKMKEGWRVMKRVEQRFPTCSTRTTGGKFWWYAAAVHTKWSYLVKVGSWKSLLEKKKRRGASYTSIRMGCEGWGETAKNRLGCTFSVELLYRQRYLFLVLCIFFFFRISVLSKGTHKQLSMCWSAGKASEQNL